MAHHELEILIKVRERSLLADKVFSTQCIIQAVKGSGPSEILFDVLRPQLNMLRPDEICLAFHGAGI